MIALVGYILSIFAANWSLQQFGIVPVGFGLSAPAGVLWVGLSFTLRDLAQERLSNRSIVVAIIVGAGLSLLVAPAFAVASGLAFLFAELCDFAVYTPLRQRSFLGAVALSNTAGTVVDSVVFLWLAFGSLQFIEGQIVAKTYMTIAALFVLWVVRVVVPQWSGAAGTVGAD
jgi:queuosine precursor transporter